MADELDLVVSIPAPELAHLQRRVLYLEAVLIQVLREGNRVKEWFSAAELLAMRLPGLPTTRAGLTRLAGAERWPRRRGEYRGRTMHLYHFSGLPRRAFDTLIDRVIGAGADEIDAADVAPALAPPPAPLPAPAANSASPPWLLPLMRMIRTEAPATVREAIAILPEYLPAGISPPSMDEVLPTLRRLGLS
ncbi:MAG: hypothetical protein HQL40_13095 [Alphaproteobacteria bacterium]|nr:hypothetical protein [Alphaproteobacteria bacterium]